MGAHRSSGRAKRTSDDLAQRLARIAGYAPSLKRLGEEGWGGDEEGLWEALEQTLSQQAKRDVRWSEQHVTASDTCCSAALLPLEKREKTPGGWDCVPF